MDDPRTEAAGPRISRMIPLVAGALVVVLAMGALIWPRQGNRPGDEVLLVFDSSGDTRRAGRIGDALAASLAGSMDRAVEPVVATSREEFRKRLELGVGFILCPDGLALELTDDAFVPLVAARRAAPYNLRPRSVLVFRRSAGLVEKPWDSRPGRTVLGDSLSLTATGGLRGSSGPAVQCSCGPDPYDHGPVLHAARLGGFDYAVVRQWDADRFFDTGLMTNGAWGREVLTTPVPDLVVMASARIPVARRLEIRERLTSVGRREDSRYPQLNELAEALGAIRVTGFNLFLEPELAAVRRDYSGEWPRRSD